MDLWEDMSYENLMSHLYNERIMIVLPYRKYIEDGFKGYEFLAVLEENLGDVALSPMICAISKGDESPVFTAIRGLYNETGYKVSDEDIISLGAIDGSRFTKSTFSLYSVNLEDKKRHSFIRTNEFKTKKEKVYEWFKKNDVIEVESAILNTIMNRLWDKLNEK